VPVGTVIGSGIFLLPGGVLQQNGGHVSLALTVWFLDGILSLLGALTYGDGRHRLEHIHRAAWGASAGIMTNKRGWQMGRSSYQLDIWQATHGPVGTDGYPVPLFDKKTGAINRDVVTYMRAKGYDLSAFARDHWTRLGPLLRGKIHVFAGEMDEFYLNLAVYKFQEMVTEVAGSDYPIRFEDGRPKKGHNWHHTDWAGVIREVAAYVRRIAPRGAIAQWNY